MGVELFKDLGAARIVADMRPKFKPPCVRGRCAMAKDVAGKSLVCNKDWRQPPMAVSWASANSLVLCGVHMRSK